MFNFFSVPCSYVAGLGARSSIFEEGCQFFSDLAATSHAWPQFGTFDRRIVATAPLI
jgi:hypothetical protein